MQRKGLIMEKVKMIIIAVWGALMSALGVLAVPVLLLVFCNVIDYFTGGNGGKVSFTEHKQLQRN